jgi:hypothetical protein
MRPATKPGPGFSSASPLPPRTPRCSNRPEWQFAAGTGRSDGVDGFWTGESGEPPRHECRHQRAWRPRPGAASAMSGPGRRAAHACGGRSGSPEEDNIDENSAEHFSAAPARSRSGGPSERGPSQLRRAPVGVLLLQVPISAHLHVRQGSTRPRRLNKGSHRWRRSGRSAMEDPRVCRFDRRRRELRSGGPGDTKLAEHPTGSRNSGSVVRGSFHAPPRGA